MKYPGGKTCSGPNNSRKSLIKEDAGICDVSLRPGSGKTAVLVGNVPGTDEKHPIDVDHLLVVTLRKRRKEMKKDYGGT